MSQLIVESPLSANQPKTHKPPRRQGGMFAVLTGISLAAVAWALPNPASAQAIAGCSTITVVTPYAPGGAMDAIARLLAEQYRKSFGQTVVVDNKPGAGGVLGSTLVMRAAPNGCTVLFTNSGAMVVQSVLKSPPPYDPATSFTPIAKVADAPTYIGVNADLPVKSMGDLIALAKKKPGTVSYASPGVGSFGHFVGEYLKIETGVDLIHVPVNGAMAVTEVGSGRIDIIVDPTVMAHRAGGRLRVLATTAGSRMAPFLDVPTSKETGGPAMDMVGWYGVVGPANMPKDLVEKFEAASLAMLTNPAARTAIEGFGFNPAPAGAAALAASIPRDIKLYGDIKTRANININ
jgi:tripartite-type tricarboxylate transporter receptor subunit TctC